MLVAYENATTQLFQALTSPTALIPLATLDGYINSARMQVASEGECIRVNGSTTLVPGQAAYPFADFTALDPNPGGVASVLAVRAAWRDGVGAIDIRPYEWFTAYYWARGSVTALTPSVVAQQGQGSNGNLWVWPTPLISTALLCDAVWLPIALVNDGTTEALPYPWTDAVPFYAAWLAMMNAQRQADADAMFGRYEQVMMRLARMGATPSELPSSMPNDRSLQRTG